MTEIIAKPAGVVNSVLLGCSWLDFGFGERSARKLRSPKKIRAAMEFQWPLEKCNKEAESSSHQSGHTLPDPSGMLLAESLRAQAA